MAPGEFVCIAGPSGCGKSTVLNTIAGLEVPFEGEILVEGAPVYSPRPDVGMVFQQPHLFPWKSVRSNIAHGPRMLGKSTTEAYAIADDLIAMVGLKRLPTLIRTHCPAACNSAWRSRERWPISPVCC